MAKLDREAQEVLADAVASDPTIQAPPGQEVPFEMRPLTRDDANLSGLVERPRERINTVQHEFAPLVRKLDDEAWRKLARGDGGSNWRIIRQDFIEV